MPTPNVTAPPAQQPKTLPHALARAAAQSSNALNTPSGETRLGQALKEYALAFEKIGAARLDQDDGELADDSGVMTFYPLYHLCSNRGSFPCAMAGELILL